MNDLWLARISSLSNEVGLYVVLLEVLLFMPNSLIRHWDNHLSEKIYINQGIQQGEKLSTSLYKCYNNAILDSVTESGIGSHLGTISVAAPTCADGILILAHSECELQSIMDIIYHHTQRDLVKINPQKSDLICYNTSSERKINIGDCKVSRSTCTKHLGISRNEKNSINIDEKTEIRKSSNLWHAGGQDYI